MYVYSNPQLDCPDIYDTHFSLRCHRLTLYVPDVKMWASPGVLRVAPPCFYSGPDWTGRTDSGLEMFCFSVWLTCHLTRSELLCPYCSLQQPTNDCKKKKKEGHSLLHSLSFEQRMIDTSCSQWDFKWVFQWAKHSSYACCHGPAFLFIVCVFCVFFLDICGFFCPFSGVLFSLQNWDASLSISLQVLFQPICPFPVSRIV